SVSHPRMLAMFLARKHTSASHSDIGRYFGGRNHSTVVAAEKKVRSWLGTDVQLACGHDRRAIGEMMSGVGGELSRGGVTGDRWGVAGEVERTQLPHLSPPVKPGKLCVLAKPFR